MKSEEGEVSEWFKELVLKTSDSARGRGFESHLLRCVWKQSYNFIWFILIQLIWRSTQEAEGTPLEREQVVNSGARVQIPPSPLTGQLRNFL